MVETLQFESFQAVWKITCRNPKDSNTTKQCRQKRKWKK